MNARCFLAVPLAWLFAHAALAAPPVRLDGSAFIVIPDQAKISGKAVQVGTLPIQRNAPYLVAYGACRTGLEVPMHLMGMTAAAISPDGAWIAYTCSRGVVVADLSGFVVDQEPAAVSCRWAPAGARLALILRGSRAESPCEGTSGEAIEIWQPNWAARTIRGEVDDLAWGTSGALFVRRGDQIRELDPESGESARTSHHGVIVSPDGLYSVDYRNRYLAAPRIVHDRTSTDLSDVTIATLGTCTPEHFDRPFWVPGQDHLLCLSVCGEWVEANGVKHWGCRTSVVDVMTSEVVAAWPGNALGRSADGRSVWITDGFEMRPQRFDVAIEPR